MSTIRAAIVGVGNCASSLVQGVEFYRNVAEEDFIPGLMHVNLGGYFPRDIVFSAAFDVGRNKVGLDLAEAIGVAPNNTVRFATVPPLGVPVRRGPTNDGLGRYLKDQVPESLDDVVDVAAILRETQTESLDFVPPCRFGEGYTVVCGAGAGSRVRFHQLHTRFHRLRCAMATAFRSSGSAAPRR